MTAHVKSFLTAFWTSTSPYSIQGQQLINLGMLLLVGKFFLNLHVSWLMVGLIVLMSIVVEHFFLLVRDGGVQFFSISAILTALGLSFMVNASSAVIFAVVLVVSLAQKYILRIWGHHVFNPSNLAVTLALLLFPDETHVFVGQWGNYWIFGLILLMFGFAILYRVKRLWIPLAFLAIYAPIQYVMSQSSAFVTPEDIILRIFSGSFLIYSFFMLTDPRTTPAKSLWQGIFVAMVAVVATLFDIRFGPDVEHLFWSLTVVSALVPLMRIVSGEENRGAKIPIPAVFLISLVFSIGFIVAIYYAS